MELGVFWRSLRQRWYLVLALVLLTGAATYLVAERVGLTYQATGTVLVFPPSETRGPAGDTMEGNPYLGLDGVNQARDVLVRALTSKGVVDEFAEEFSESTSFEVVPDYTNSAPIMLFTVEAKTPQTAVAALQMLMDRVPLELAELQSGLDLPVPERVTSLTLTADERPATTHKDQLRAAILSAAVLGGSGLLLIALIDGLLAGRRKKFDAATPFVGEPAATKPPAAKPSAANRPATKSSAAKSSAAKSSAAKSSAAKPPSTVSTTVVKNPRPPRQRAAPTGARGDGR